MFGVLSSEVKLNLKWVVRIREWSSGGGEEGGKK